MASLAGSGSHSFACRPEAIWPLVADTARFNEAFGVPRHEILELPRPDGSVDFQARAEVRGFKLQWREIPASWVANQWYEHRREFFNGPLRSLTATFRLRPQGEDASVGDYEILVEPRGLLGRLIGPVVLRKGLANFHAAMATAEARALGRRDTTFDYTPPPADAVTQARVARLVEQVEASGHGHGLAARLSRKLLTGQEIDLLRLRPLALARDWGTSAREAVELCLQATRQGLLALTWSLLCPRCRGAKVTTAALDELPNGAHCPTCNVDFGRDFSKNVELAFRPAAAVRPLTQGEYCLFGPQSVPHIKLQVGLAPGERRVLPASLSPGSYAYRTLEPGPQREVEIDARGAPAFHADGSAVTVGPPNPVDGDAGGILLANESDRPLTFIVEDRAWLADALTADRAATFQAFRDLFSDQVLRPGDEVAVQYVALLFTDLSASTALYRRIGDASAYHLVRDHFALLAGIVRQHEGAIVKTIGDAIMAAFHRPADGVRAALAIQRALADFNRVREQTPLAIKIGLHGGPCIAVTLNERLDYFGSTANLAARLQSESQGGDVTLSKALAEDPEVAAAIRDLSTEAAWARLKGFDEPIAFLRVRP